MSSKHLILLFFCAVLAPSGVLAKQVPVHKKTEPAGQQGNSSGENQQGPTAAETLAKLADQPASVSEGNGRLLDSFMQANTADQISTLHQVLTQRMAVDSKSTPHRHWVGHGHHAKDHPWDYDLCSVFGPLRWAEHFPSCGGHSQSPINIVTPDVTYDRRHFLRYTHAHTTPISGDMTNNGHAPTFKPKKASGTLGLYGVPYDEKNEYTLMQFHFHFHDQKGEGTEHSINGEKQEAELHLVYLNSRYGSSEEAQNHPDGFTVVGILLQVGYPADARMSEIIQGTRHVIAPDSTHPITVQSLAFLEELKGFYTYRGSLTTPGCSESVTWIILRDHVIISPKDIRTLNRLLDAHHKPMTGNIRPIQHRKGRRVEANFPEPSSGIPDTFAKAEVTSSQKQTKRQPIHGNSKSQTVQNDIHAGQQSKKQQTSNKQYRTAATSGERVAKMVNSQQNLQSVKNVRLENRKSRGPGSKAWGGAKRPTTEQSVHTTTMEFGEFSNTGNVQADGYSSQTEIGTTSGRGGYSGRGFQADGGNYRAEMGEGPETAYGEQTGTYSSQQLSEGYAWEGFQ